MNEANSEYYWKERSLNAGNSINGVLFKNLPEIINQHIHQWHLYSILKFIGNEKPGKILDVGCGYGRLSLPLLKKLSPVEIIGIDISPHYVELYKQQTGSKALVSSVENIPQDLGQFDCILLVTILMYLPSSSIQATITKLMQYLKPEGKIILIEHHCSGKIFQSFFGLRTLIDRLRNKSSNKSIGCCFKGTEIKNLINTSNGIIVHQLRIPITTIFIIPLYLIAKILPNFLCQIILNIVSFLDKFFGQFRLPSIHTVYLIKKNDK